MFFTGVQWIAAEYHPLYRPTGKFGTKYGFMEGVKFPLASVLTSLTSKDLKLHDPEVYTFTQL